MNLTASELELREYAINMRDSCNMSYATALGIVLDTHKDLVAKANGEVAEASAKAAEKELDELTPSGKMVVLASRQASRGYKEESLGDFVRRRRKELGLSSRELALACGCGEATIASIEGGNFGDLEKVRLTLLAKKLKVTLAALQDLIPTRDARGKRVRSKLQFTLDDVRTAAELHPKAYQEYDRAGQSSTMGDASWAALYKAYAYMDAHPGVEFREAVTVVFETDQELYSQYDTGQVSR